MCALDHTEGFAITNFFINVNHFSVGFTASAQTKPILICGQRLRLPLKMGPPVTAHAVAGFQVIRGGAHILDVISAVALLFYLRGMD